MSSDFEEHQIEHQIDLYCYSRIVDLPEPNSEDKSSHLHKDESTSGQSKYNNLNKQGQEQSLIITAKSTEKFVDQCLFGQKAALGQYDLLCQSAKTKKKRLPKTKADSQCTKNPTRNFFKHTGIYLYTWIGERIKKFKGYEKLMQFKKYYDQFELIDRQVLINKKWHLFLLSSDDESRKCYLEYFTKYCEKDLRLSNIKNKELYLIQLRSWIVKAEKQIISEENVEKYKKDIEESKQKLKNKKEEEKRNQQLQSANYE